MASTRKSKPGVGIYTRLSKDDGTKESTDRQEKACRALAKQRGWQVVEVFTDKDLSAFNRKTVRPRYQDMILAIEAGRIDGVITWRLDRLVRRFTDAAPLISDEWGSFIVTVADGIDTTTATGRVLAGIMSVLAESESEGIRTRVQAAKRSAALAGHPPPAGGRTFGYRRLKKSKINKSKRLVVVEEEATLIRTAARGVLAGVPVASICREWNAKGIPTARKGKGWTVTTLRRLLISPMAAGLSVYHRGRPDEATVEGNWEAIIDRETHASLVALFSDPARRKGRTSSPRYLLSGLMRCGRCGEILRHVPANTSHPSERYRCHSREGLSCGRLTVQAQNVGPLIEEAVLQRLSSQKLLKALVKRESRPDITTMQEELAAVESSLDRLAHAHYVDSTLTNTRYQELTSELVVKRNDLDQRLAASVDSKILTTHLSLKVDIRERWKKLSTEERRAILGAIIERIEVAPATNPRGTGVFDESRVNVIWKV